MYVPRNFQDGIQRKRFVGVLNIESVVQLFWDINSDIAYCKGSGRLSVSCTLRDGYPNLFIFKLKSNTVYSSTTQNNVSTLLLFGIETYVRRRLYATFKDLFPLLCVPVWKYHMRSRV